MRSGRLMRQSERAGNSHVANVAGRPLFLSRSCDGQGEKAQTMT